MTRRGFLPLLTPLAIRAQRPVLDLPQFEPKSALHVAGTEVKRARFPLLDIHTHLSWGDPKGEKANLILPPVELLKVMDAKNLRTLVNLTGGYGRGLAEGVQLLSQAHPGRFLVFTQPWFPRVAEPGYAKFQGDEIRSEEHTSELQSR